MNNYTKYKPSDVKWIGEIPENWNVRRIKYLFKEIDQRSTSENEELLSVSQYTGVKPKKDCLESDNEKITNAESLEGYKRVSKNDLVINIMLAWNGSLGVSDYEGIVSPAYCVYRIIDSNNPKYFDYLFRTDLYKTEFKRNSTGVIDSRLRLYTDKFFNIFSTLPSLNEQTTIVNYLEHKTAQIDTFIAKKKHFIDLLKEQRIAMINQAVTKGINPNVKMKPSGTEWLGKIPEHWESRKLKFLIKGKLEYGANEPAELNDPSFPRYIRITDIYNDGKLKNDTFKSLKPEIAKDYLLQEGDVLFARSGATVGKTFQFKSYDSLACFAGYLIKATPDENKILSDYLYNFTKSRAYDNWINSIFIQATIQNIGADKYAFLQIPLPPLPEQIQIINYIKYESEPIYHAIAKAEREIELIKEYRTALISEVVIGKVDVSAEYKSFKNSVCTQSNLCQ